ELLPAPLPPPHPMATRVAIVTIANIPRRALIRVIASNIALLLLSFNDARLRPFYLRSRHRASADVADRGSIASPKQKGPVGMTPSMPVLFRHPDRERNRRDGARISSWHRLPVGSRRRPTNALQRRDSFRYPALDFRTEFHARRATHGRGGIHL